MLGKRTMKQRNFDNNVMRKSSFFLQGKIYFLTYPGFSKLLNRNLVKDQLRDYLLYQNKNERKIRPEKYLVCQQMYDSGQPHFHVILVYSRRKQVLNQSFFDYHDVHPNIQTMRNMTAALAYVHKQDPAPLTNMDVARQLLIARSCKNSSIYGLLQQNMLKDPFNFSFETFCLDNGIFSHVYKTNYPKAKNLIKIAQQAYCHRLLTDKKHLKVITRARIQSRLTEHQLKVYDSWSGYQTIVDYLNQIPNYGSKRPLKTKNLLITGPPNIGKTSLFHNPNHASEFRPLEDFVSIFPMGMDTWFPNYKSNVYGMILWNEAKLSSYPYDIILKVLQGSYTDLPVKGGVVTKRDNPLVVMTSNMTLDQMIRVKFGYNKDLQHLAKMNLGVRVENVIVPKGHNLFLLQKLF